MSSRSSIRQEEKDKAEETAGAEQKNEAPAPEKGPAQMTLPELLAYMTRTVLEDPKQMPKAKKALELWYLAQDDEDRKELVRKTKKTVETMKLAGEAFFMTIMEITSGEQ